MGVGDEGRPPRPQHPLRPRPVTGQYPMKQLVWLRSHQEGPGGTGECGPRGGRPGLGVWTAAQGLAAPSPTAGAAGQGPSVEGRCPWHVHV